MAIKVAYIVARFPSVSQTFILREILELCNQGFDITIFPLKSKPDKLIHDDAKKILTKVYYISPFSIKVLLSQIYFFITSPLKYFYLVYFVVKNNLRNPYALIISLGLIPKSVHIALMIKRQKICHIHAHMATFQASCALFISVLTGVPFSFTAHATDIRGDQADRTHDGTNMLQEKLERAKFIVTCTDDNVIYLRKKHMDIAPEKIILNYHGIDTDKFSPKKCEEQPPLILAVGRLLECKGFEYLIDACQILREKNLSFNCMIVGNGPDKGILEKRIDKSDLGDIVELAGAKSQEELIELYNKASLFVLPSISESHFGIPNTLFEAMSMTVPVIVSNLPAVKELIASRDEGIVIPEKNVDILVKEIEQLLRDSQLRKLIGKNGRKKIIENFSVKEKVKELRYIFENKI